MYFQIRNNLALVSIEYAMPGKTAGAIKITLLEIIYGQHTFGFPNKWEIERIVSHPRISSSPLTTYFK